MYLRDIIPGQYIRESKIPAVQRIVLEGGNVFKDKDKNVLTQRINQADVDPTVRWLEKITGYSVYENMLGTTGKKPTSGDLDIGMPSDISKEDLIERLSKWCAENRLNPAEYIKKSGISVHFKTPINGVPEHGYVQTDFMFIPNLNFAKFSMAADPNSTYKDAHKHVTLSSLAKFHNYKWSPTIGLINRANDELVSDDPDRIAQLLVGPNASRADITSVESIVRSLQNDPNGEAKLADARVTLDREGLKI